MTKTKGLVALLVTIVLSAGYVAATAWLGIREFWAGFLFLTQWGLMEQARIDRLPPSAIGALVGVGLAALLVYLPPLLGATPGLLVALAAILMAVYMIIMGWAPLAINAATMIFLAVATIPHLAQPAIVPGVFTGLASGVVYFGGLAAVAGQVTKRTSPT